MALSTAFLVFLVVAGFLGALPGWLTLLLLLLVALSVPGLLSVRYGLRRLAVSERGVHMGPTSTVFVPWTAIKSVRLTTWLWMTTAYLRAERGAVQMPPWMRPYYS